MSCCLVDDSHFSNIMKMKKMKKTLMWNFLILSSPIDLKGLCAHDCKNHKDIRASACINSFVRSALHHRCTTHQTCNGI
jgi:hypothetical protein